MPPKATQKPVVNTDKPTTPITYSGLVSRANMHPKEFAAAVREIERQERIEVRKSKQDTDTNAPSQPQSSTTTGSKPSGEILGTFSDGKFTSTTTTKLKAKQKAKEPKEETKTEGLKEQKLTQEQPKTQEQLKLKEQSQIQLQDSTNNQDQDPKEVKPLQSLATVTPLDQAKSKKSAELAMQSLETSPLQDIGPILKNLSQFMEDQVEEQGEIFSPLSLALLPKGSLPVITERDDLKLIKEANFYQVQNYILTNNIVDVASNLKGSLWNVVADSANLNNPKSVAELTSNILTKIAIYEESQNIKDSKTLVAQAPVLARLKVDTLLYQQQNIFKILTEEKEQVIVIRTASDSINQIEEAYLLYRLLEKKPNALAFQSLISFTSEVLYDIISTVADPKIQFNLFKSALKSRVENFSNDHVYLTDLLIKLGNYGVTLSEEGVKFEATRYSQQGYDIICKQPELTQGLKQDLINLLGNMSKISSEFFGDKGLATIYAKHIERLGGTAPDIVKAKLSGQKSASDLNIAITKPLIPIITSGLSSDIEMQIKKQIQVNVLDKIQAASAKGKWTELSLSRAEQGVNGYLDQKWLFSQLGELSSKDNYEIALELCFEAINIGIMNSEKRDYSCAVIFSQKYPQIVQKIVQQHPEYFVDGYVLQVSQQNANDHSQRLIGLELKVNEGGYNHYFEEEMGIIINSRIKQAILDPIGNIVRNKQWDKQIENTLLNKLNQTYIKSVIGNNLSMIEDVFSIVRIMAFDVLVKTTLAESSSNYSPIAVFAAHYKGLIGRIKADHPELLSDQNISSWVNKSSGESSANPVVHEAGNPAIAFASASSSSDSKSEMADRVNPKADNCDGLGGSAANSSGTTGSNPVGYFFSMFSRSSSVGESASGTGKDVMPAAIVQATETSSTDMKVAVSGEVGATE